jgi:methylmalonyl-CoA mutase N-terminal domain/subunit
MERTSGPGLPVDPVYDASKLTDFPPEAKPGRPGEYPFNCGAYLRGDGDRLRATRRYAGFAPAPVPAPSRPGPGAAREIDEGERIVVGVNKSAADGTTGEM